MHFHPNWALRAPPVKRACIKQWDNWMMHLFPIPGQILNIRLLFHVCRMIGMSLSLPFILIGAGACQFETIFSGAHANAAPSQCFSDFAPQCRRCSSFCEADAISGSSTLRANFACYSSPQFFPIFLNYNEDMFMCGRESSFIASFPLVFLRSFIFLITCATVCTKNMCDSIREWISISGSRDKASWSAACPQSQIKRFSAL